MEDYNFELYERFRKDFWYIKARIDLLRRILRKQYGNRKNLKILDAGCGTGFNFDALTGFGDVYGADLSANALKQAKRSKYAKLLLKDVNKLDYENYFDVIIAVEIIEHIKEDFKVIQNFKKYLKPGGILIITTPAFMFLWSSDDEISHHIRRYSKKRLAQIVHRSGLLPSYIGFRYFFMFIPAFLIFMFQNLGKKRTNSLEYTPGIFNSLLLQIMKLENKLILNKLSLPVGAGLICIAKKR